MSRRSQGFTLIELMIVVVIIGILAAIAIPNFIAMQDRAHEGSTKSNMHTLQLTTEDWGVQHDSFYPNTAAQIVSIMPSAGFQFKNPFDGTTGSNNAWADIAGWANPLPTGTTKSGLVVYSDSSLVRYQISGRGKSSDFTLILSSGQ